MLSPFLLFLRCVICKSAKMFSSLLRRTIPSVKGWMRCTKRSAAADCCAAALIAQLNHKCSHSGLYLLLIKYVIGRVIAVRNPSAGCYYSASHNCFLYFIIRWQSSADMMDEGGQPGQFTLLYDCESTCLSICSVGLQQGSCM